MLVNIPNTKNKKPRKFAVTDQFFTLYKKYRKLRPQNMEREKLFISYRGGKCTKQVVGIHSIGIAPRTIAEFLNLDEPEKYTGHCFRRTSATTLVNSGAELLALKRHGGWLSSAVAETYIEESLSNKKRVGQELQNQIFKKPCLPTSTIVRPQQDAIDAIEVRNTASIITLGSNSEKSATNSTVEPQNLELQIPDEISSVIAMDEVQDGPNNFAVYNNKEKTNIKAFIPTNSVINFNISNNSVVNLYLNKE